MGRTAQPEKETRRKRRRDVNEDLSGFNQRLAIPRHLVNNPDYAYRWVNDEDTNISKASANDYDFANENGEMVDRSAPDCYCVHAGTLPNGSPLMTYLMRKHKDWYDADKAREQTAIDEKMKAIQSDAENPSDVHRYKPNKDIRID